MIVKCIDSEYDRLFGGFSSAQLQELWQLTIIIDKRARRKINVSNYQHVLERAEPTLVALAWLMVYGTDEEVINFIHGVMM